jgi:hypothetical protein
MMTTDEEMHLALHWSIADVAGDQLVTSTMNWKDKTKVNICISIFVPNYSLF